MTRWEIRRTGRGRFEARTVAGLSLLILLLIGAAVAAGMLSRVIAVAWAWVGAHT